MIKNQMRDFFPFPEIRVFTSWKKYKRYYKTVTGHKTNRDKPVYQDSIVSYIGGATNRAIIYFADCVSGYDPAMRAAVVAHECSHIVDHYLDTIGEDEPGTEFRAYCMDSLVSAVLAQLGEEWLTRPA